MKRSYVITLALLAMLVTASAVQAAPQPSPFSGTWIGIDTLDGSTVHLVVLGGSHARIDYQDDNGQACRENEATDLWLSASLRATVDGNTMTGAFKSAKCGRVSLSFMRRQAMVWTFDGQGTPDLLDDKLIDGVVTWRRA